MDVVDFLNERLLSFADDIVPVDKQEIIDFFHSINRAYNEDHVNLLSQIGGNDEAKIITWQGIALLEKFSFEDLKVNYLEPDIIDLQYPDPPHICYVGRYFDGEYIINIHTGKIYDHVVSPDSDDFEKYLCYPSIKAFLFSILLYYFERISNFISFKELHVEEADEFRQKNEQYRLPSADNDKWDHYIIKDKFYFLSKIETRSDEPKLIDNKYQFVGRGIFVFQTYQFTPEFYKELQDFKKAHNLE